MISSPPSLSFWGQTLDLFFSRFLPFSAKKFKCAVKNQQTKTIDFSHTIVFPSSSHIYFVNLCKPHDSKSKSISFEIWFDHHQWLVRKCSMMIIYPKTWEHYCYCMLLPLYWLRKRQSHQQHIVFFMYTIPSHQYSFNFQDKWLQQRMTIKI